MAGGGDLVGFRGRAMVGPHDHVPAVFTGHRRCDRPTGAVKRDERAGGIEGDALDLEGSDVSAVMVPRTASHSAVQISSELCSA